MFWLALAAQLSAPVPVGLRVPDIRTLFTVEDFPQYLLRSGISLTVLTKTTVRPDGTVENCVAEASSGDSNLDAYTCNLIAKRAKFAPARWTDGSPAYGVVRAPIGWMQGNEPPPKEVRQAMGPDLALLVNKLPGAAHSPVMVYLLIAADENGRALNCEESPAAAANPNLQHFPDLVSAACQQMTAKPSVTPLLDSSGKPVRSVQGVSVRFQLDH